MGLPPRIVLLELGCVPSHRFGHEGNSLERLRCLRLCDLCKLNAPLNRVPSKIFASPTGLHRFQIARPHHDVLLAMELPIHLNQPPGQSRSNTTKIYARARPKEIAVTARKLLRVAVPVIQERNQLVLELKCMEVEIHLVEKR